MIKFELERVTAASEIAMLATLLVLGVRLPTRRTLLTRAAALGTGLSTPRAATAEIGPESNWPLWLALPVAPYSRRKTRAPAARAA